MRTFAQSAIAETEFVGPTMTMPNFLSGRPGAAAAAASVALRVLVLAVVLIPATASLADGQDARRRSPEHAAPVALPTRPGESHTITLGDVDGDGRLDVFVLGTPWGGEGLPRHRLWLNDGNGSFVDGGQDFGERFPHPRGNFPDAFERHAQIALDVIVQRFEGGNVKEADAFRGN